MPTAAERLTKKSTEKQIDEAISSCISQRQHENRDEEVKQSVAICFAMARKATGKALLRQALKQKG